MSNRNNKCCNVPFVNTYKVYCNTLHHYHIMSLFLLIVQKRDHEKIKVTKSVNKTGSSFEPIIASKLYWYFCMYQFYIVSTVWTVWTNRHVNHGLSLPFHSCINSLCLCVCETDSCVEGRLYNPSRAFCLVFPGFTGYVQSISPSHLFCIIFCFCAK